MLNHQFCSIFILDFSIHNFCGDCEAIVSCLVSQVEIFEEDFYQDIDNVDDVGD